MSTKRVLQNETGWSWEYNKDDEVYISSQRVFIGECPLQVTVKISKPSWNLIIDRPSISMKMHNYFGSAREAAKKAVQLIDALDDSEDYAVVVSATSREQAKAMAKSGDIREVQHE